MGTFLSRHLAGRIPRLRLMCHRTPLARDVLEVDGVEAVRADLGDPRTIPPAVQGVDVIVHFAGVLFAPRPARFLPVTNVKSKVRRRSSGLPPGGSIANPCRCTRPPVSRRNAF